MFRSVCGQNSKHNPQSVYIGVSVSELIYPLCVSRMIHPTSISTIPQVPHYLGRILGIATIFKPINTAFFMYYIY